MADAEMHRHTIERLFPMPGAVPALVDLEREVAGIVRAKDFHCFIELIDQLGQSRAKGCALRKLTTIGEACRAMLRETLRSTIAWVIEQVTEHSRDYDHVVIRLGFK